MIELDLLTMCNENLSKIITTIFSCQPRNRSLMGVVSKDTFLFSQRTDAVSLSLFLYIVDMEGGDVFYLTALHQCSVFVLMEKPYSRFCKYLLTIRQFSANKWY